MLGGGGVFKCLILSLVASFWVSDCLIGTYIEYYGMLGGGGVFKCLILSLVASFWGWVS